MENEVIDCTYKRFCGRTTRMLGTKLCDGCWELSTRIRGDQKLAEFILEQLRKEREHGPS